MLPSERVILFGHARSGSSSLYEILQLHPQLNILEEPFNENFINWEPGNKDYLALVRDVASLSEQLAEIFGAYDGLKMLDYQLGDLTEHVLLRPDCRIIFIRRRNCLQTAVSDRIAHQTNLWKKWDMVQPLEAYYARLAPLDVEDLRRYVIGMRHAMERWDAVLDGRADGHVFKVVHEDLYFAPVEEQHRMLDALWKFLGLEPLRSEWVDYYLRPESVKLNSSDAYSFVPNAQEIDKLCGSDETGWLFGRPTRVRSGR